MSKFHLKPKAHKLRREGVSLGDISDELGISKGTASKWCSEIKLTKSQEQKLKDKVIFMGMEGRLKGARMNREKKLQSIRDAKQWAQSKISKISNRDRFVANIALYWAEGSKKDTSNGFNIVNSDPDMIAFVYNWLVDDLDIKKDMIMPRIVINASHKDRTDNILIFWSNLLELPKDRFGKVNYIQSKHKKLYKNRDNYFGVLRLGVSKSTVLRYRILALIDILKS